MRCCFVCQQTVTAPLRGSISAESARGSWSFQEIHPNGHGVGANGLVQFLRRSANGSSDTTISLRPLTYFAILSVDSTIAMEALHFR